jgi:preprotein translocase subunit SecA
MLENPVLKVWPPMEQVDAKFLSGMIQKTQERIEHHFFEARKNVLEYDDVLNAQREHIYGMRRDILLGKNCREDLKQQTQESIAEHVGDAWMIEDDGSQVYDYHVLFEDLNEIFPLVDYATITDLEQFQPGPDLIQFCQQKSLEAYDAKVEALGEEIMRMIEQQVLLRAVNDKWMEHLQTVEYIREGIGLRGYGQVDPLVAYKRETYDTFQTTLRGIREQAVTHIFHAQVQIERQAEPQAPMMMRMDPEALESEASQQGALPASATANLDGIDWKRVGRNDPCPCGSGKKFKACHYPQLREQGVI